MENTNTISKIFKYIAIGEFFLGGIGSGIIMADEAVIGIVALICVFVTGMLFLGIAEIIKLLQVIADKTVSQPKVFTSEASIIEDIESELPVL